MAYLNAKYHANQITVNTPQWKLTIGDTQANRKVLMVFLRALQEPVKDKHREKISDSDDQFQKR